MSELGSNQGQDENKNTTVFDSANLAEKQKAEHFTNVEGSEARAKAAERQAEAAKKKAEAAHAGEIKKAAKQANKEAGGSKGGILRFLFGGWHKWVTVVLAIALAASIIFAFVKLMPSLGHEVTKKGAEQKTEEFRVDCEAEEAESGYCLSSIDAYEAYISSVTDTKIKIQLLKQYEEDMMDKYGDAVRVETFLDNNIPQNYDEKDKYTLCSIYSDLYYEAENWEKYYEACEL